VQLVLRPTHDFRGYAGQICSGVVNIGDTVTVWPSGRSSRVKRIVTWEGDIDRAFAPMSITLTLEDELDISRGDLLATGPVEIGRRFEADLVWMDERPLDPGRPYLLKHGTRILSGEINQPFALNQIGRATVSVSRPLAFDSYRHDRGTGSFILIDPSTNFTAGAGMIAARVPEHHHVEATPGAARRLADAARAAGSDAEAVDAVRRLLEEILV
jgi:sulfate adenylyltransferase subunit 1 (EFTu-like GTPase family)